jgi:hypothetical protein
MGTTLTGTTPQDTYDSLIKVTDNGPLSGTLKALSDGLGNDSTLSLSTTAASIAGTLAVTGALSGSTATFSGQGQFNAVSTGAYLLLNAPTNGGTITMQADGVSFADIGSELGNFGSGSATNLCVSARATKDLILGGGALKTMTLTSAGNVGIGTTTSSYDTNKIGSSHRFLNVQAGAGLYAVGTLAGNQSGNNDRLGYLTFVNDNNSASYKYSAWLGSEVEGTTANQQGGRLIFSTTSDASSAGPIERMRITSAGVLDLAQGQIKFPATQVASDNANTLDDYEEGTFTPSFAPTVGAFTSATYSVQYGKFTKIGNRVDINIQISLSAVSVGTAAGVISIGGLPFTVGAKPCPFSISIVQNWDSGKFPVNGFFNDGASNCLLRYVSALNANDNYIGGADITNTSSITLSGTYFV